MMAIRSGMHQARGRGGKTSAALKADNDEIAEHTMQVEAAGGFMHRYDADRNGKLEKHEVQKLLTDMSGYAVSQNEVDFVFKIADTNRDQAINAQEVKTLLNCWHNYQGSRAEIERHFRKHDPNGTGHLDKRQLKGLLVEMSQGQPVSDEQVAWVLQQSDTLKNGVLTKPELRRALALWQCHLDGQKVCCVLM